MRQILVLISSILGACIICSPKGSPGERGPGAELLPWDEWHHSALATLPRMSLAFHSQLFSIQLGEGKSLLQKLFQSLSSLLPAVVRKLGHRVLLGYSRIKGTGIPGSSWGEDGGGKPSAQGCAD